MVLVPLISFSALLVITFAWNTLQVIIREIATVSSSPFYLCSHRGTFLVFISIIFKALAMVLCLASYIFSLYTLVILATLSALVSTTIIELIGENTKPNGN